MLDDHSTGSDMELAPPEGVRASDYHLIEDAVMDTARGRWFMREYARRIRAAETSQLLAALERIEKSVAHSQSIQQFEAGKLAAVEAVTPEPAGGPALHPQLGKELQAIQEKLLDIVWYMRERGFDNRLCSVIRHEAGKIERIALQPDEAQAGHVEAPEPDTVKAAPVNPPALAGSVTAFPANQLHRASSEFAPLPPVHSGEAVSETRHPAGQVFATVDALSMQDKLAMFA